jgi:putative hemolysin
MAAAAVTDSAVIANRLGAWTTKLKEAKPRMSQADARAMQRDFAQFRVFLDEVDARVGRSVDGL